MSAINPDSGHSDEALWDLISEHMRPGLAGYLTWGRPVGSFLTAILSNDLMEAARQADHINKNKLYDYADFLHNYADPRSYGSPDSVSEWINGGGAQGKAQRYET